MSEKDSGIDSVLEDGISDLLDGASRFIGTIKTKYGEIKKHGPAALAAILMARLEAGSKEAVDRNDKQAYMAFQEAIFHLKVVITQIDRITHRV